VERSCSFSGIRSLSQQLFARPNFLVDVLKDAAKGGRSVPLLIDLTPGKAENLRVRTLLLNDSSEVSIYCPK